MNVKLSEISKDFTSSSVSKRFTENLLVSELFRLQNLGQQIEYLLSDVGLTVFKREEGLFIMSSPAFRIWVKIISWNGQESVASFSVSVFSKDGRRCREPLGSFPGPQACM